MDILCDVQKDGGFDLLSRVYERTGIAVPRFRTRSARGNGVLLVTSGVKERVVVWFQDRPNDKC